jgi:hypothetical protein
MSRCAGGTAIFLMRYGARGIGEGSAQHRCWLAVAVNLVRGVGEIVKSPGSGSIDDADDLESVDYAGRPTSLASTHVSESDYMCGGDGPVLPPQAAANRTMAALRLALELLSRFRGEVRSHSCSQCWRCLVAS